MENTIKEVREKLSTNDEWIKRYKSYAEKINVNLLVHEEIRRNINEFSPLHFYIRTTDVQKPKNLKLDVRYFGQSVATLTDNNSEIYISTAKKDNKNYRDFNCEIILDKNSKWRDENAREFRKFFKENAKPRKKTSDNKGNEEHKLENLLLTEFSKRNGKDKQIRGIQPVKIFNARFGMPTPIKASNHKSLSYSKQYGGGIDILARTGRGGNSTYLTVIEVKDENNKKEPPKDALKQAIQYAVFIRELLRSESGDSWYKLFGFTGKIRKNLTIRVACAMPYNSEDDIDTSCKEKGYSIQNDKIDCHYIYFQYDRKQISNFITSLNK